MCTTIAAPAPAPQDDENKLISLREAQKLFPLVNGKPPCHVSLFNWATQGTRGVKLASIRVGRMIVTTPKSVREFLAQRMTQV